MRHLIACAECHRQYDAQRMAVGKHFRCRCGALMTVAEPRGHEARVIRCSSCGAARREGSRSCEHCASDFTLFERDLHTICPECFARVSDRAKYCHRCATLLAPEEAIGEATEFRCPACQDRPRLHSRQLGSENLSALECNACAGLWLGFEVFEHLTRSAKESEVPAVIASRDRHVTPRQDQSPQRRGYRPCPRCGSLMNRRNYGNRPGVGSGIIIEYCKSDGVWFDCGELNGILKWLKQGGDLERPTLTRTPEPSQRSPSPYTLIDDDSDDDIIGSSLFSRRFSPSRSGLGMLIDLLFDWNHRR